MLLPDADVSSAQPLSGSSSSPRASSSDPRQPSAPSYISARSADVILSEVRPTRMKSEALRSVNILLDELLWLILGCARSFATDRLRTGLLKVLPSNLGKDALLEAEVELRAYVERNPPTEALPTDEATIQQFPLQQAFELLRIKCEAYSSLGDQEEDVENETALHARMVQLAGDATPKFEAVAPAALYLTAILEHVCEHVLSNVGRVVARDSSRSAAHSQDLYVALCEDESIYSLFKTMKVQEQIEQQAKTVRPRRSKSFSRNDLITETLAPGTSADTPAVPNQRQSVDSAVSHGSNSATPNRASVEKGRSKVIFKSPSRTVGSNGTTNHTDAKHHRNNSLVGDKISLSVPEDANANVELSPDDDDESVQDFDDLMRSGTTMKVSLTPARLKTFEVFAKERNQRAGRPVIPTSTSTSSKDANSPPSAFPNGHRVSQSSKSRNQVESIAETPEGDPVRLRAASITNTKSPKVDRATTTPRSRSFTDARAHSVSFSTPNTQPDRSEAIPTSTPTMPAAVADSSGIPKNVRRQPARNRDSIDLDDLMDVSEDDVPATRKSALKPKSAQTTGSGTRELMEFLSEGPPEPSSIVTAPPSGATLEPRGTKQGRFRTIVSRLTGGSSNERLSPRSDDIFSESIQRSSIHGANGNSTSSRGPLLSKKSVPNVAAAARAMPGISPPYLESNISASGLRTRQPSLTRKAVPTWDASQEKLDPPVPQKFLPKQGDSIGIMKPLPQPIVSSPTQPSPNINPEPVSPIQKYTPREADYQSRGSAVVEVTPSSPIASLPGPDPSNGHANVDQESVKEPLRGDSKIDPHDISFGSTSSIPASEHIRDLRQLLSRATSVDECRVLVDMFLARCGAFPTDEQLSVPITPPTSPLRIQFDSHEGNLVEVLLGDSAVRGLDSLAANHTQSPQLELIERPTSLLPTATTTLTVTPSTVVESTAATISN